MVHVADIQDRDGAAPLLASIRLLFPWVRRVFADGGYAGEKLRSALACFGRYTIEIIRRSDAAKGFERLPRRWARNAASAPPRAAKATAPPSSLKVSATPQAPRTPSRRRPSY
jgi:transposase